MAKLPHSTEAEKSVLGAILLDGQTAPLIFEEVRENEFYDKNHQKIFQAMKDLYHEHRDIDFASLSSALENKAQLESVGGINYLMELSNYTVSLAHLETYIGIVKDFSLKRDIILVTQGLAQEGLTKESDVHEYLDQVESQVLSLSQRRKVGTFKPIPEIIKDIRDKLNYLQQYKGAVTGLTTGFTTLDSYINGLQPEELIILAARPSMGKSALAMNIGLNAAMYNKGGKAGVAIFSLEMSNEQLVTRMVSSLTNIENMKLRTGKLNPQEWKLFESFTERINQYNIYFDDSTSSNINEIRAKCRKLAQEKKLDLVVIDYLQLIHADTRSGANRQEEVSKISRALKQMAKELKVPVLALSQLSRDVEKSENKRPLLAHLRESGSIEQDADIVMFIHREEYYQRKKDQEPTGDAEVIIAKNRQGRIGTVKFIFATQQSRFTERSLIDEAPTS